MQQRHRFLMLTTSQKQLSTRKTKTYQAAFREGFFRRPCRRGWSLIPLPEGHWVLTKQKLLRWLRGGRCPNGRTARKKEETKQKKHAYDPQPKKEERKYMTTYWKGSAAIYTHGALFKIYLQSHVSKNSNKHVQVLFCCVSTKHRSKLWLKSPLIHSGSLGGQTPTLTNIIQWVLPQNSMSVIFLLVTYNRSIWTSMEKCGRNYLMKDEELKRWERNTCTWLTFTRCMGVSKL